jgi:hypothetical protein
MDSKRSDLNVLVGAEAMYHRLAAIYKARTIQPETDSTTLYGYTAKHR